MSGKKKGNTSQDTQLARFAEAARALGCDEDEAAFDEKLKAIARRKPKDEPASDASKPVPSRGRRKQG